MSTPPAPPTIMVPGASISVFARTVTNHVLAPDASSMGAQMDGEMLGATDGSPVARQDRVPSTSTIIPALTMRASHLSVPPVGAPPVQPPIVPVVSMPSPGTLHAFIAGPSNVPDDGQSISAALPCMQYGPLSCQGREYLDNIEFPKSADAEMMPVEDLQTTSSTVPPQFAPPITPTSSHAAPHLLVPSLGSTSTLASSMAIKRKLVKDDSSHQESCPPHSSKSGKSVTSSINTAIITLQEAVSGHFVEPLPMRKQRAIRQVQEEDDLDDHEVLKMIKVFESDIAVADSYLNITQDSVCKLFLADYLQAHEKCSN
ncbi:hypothetical protein EV702DRAFT_1198454 [Suillus placidus]|uniref:Uncharacterized protein n=1 Tax=Suillus placidus TaxID=48579 RepID=A0A9P7D1X3_9AGAM|nr:hypothetical protein EV702DRAFT_1198454 [Suillus placidus]